VLDAHGISPNTIPTNDVRAGLTVGSPEHRARMSFVVCSAACRMGSVQGVCTSLRAGASHEEDYYHPV